MKTMAVGELKTHFASVLEEVKAGHTIAVSFGRAHRKIAMIVPYPHSRTSSARKLGILSGRGTCRLARNSRLTDEAFVAS